MNSPAAVSFARTSKPLLTELLREVSRSFYLTLRILPSAIRSQIGLAYLLARVADTIADTPLVSLENRYQALQCFRQRLLDDSAMALNLGELVIVASHDKVAGQGTASERILLERAEEALGLISSFHADDQTRIREVLDTITGGQMLDLRRFGNADSARIVALDSDEELDDYTYRVAGCVGEFWTKMCRAHLFPRDSINDAQMLQRGIRFGMGLQLVNILRDLPVDLRLGRCYLPGKSLQKLGLTPSDLLDPGNEARVKPLVDAWLSRAEAHLREGWDYTCALPWRCGRVRLACSWPVLIGARTVKHLRAGAVLNPDRRIKVSRPEVRGILCQTIWRLPVPRLWNQLFPAPKP